MADKAWKDMTKEERGAKIREGREAAALERQEEPAAPVSQNDMAAAIAEGVARALASMQQTSASSPAGKKPEDMTVEERKVEHERLQKALDAIPYVADNLEGAKPGTMIGEGLTREYVPYTVAWFMDVEARKLDRNKHNGQEAELTWPNYQIHDVDYMGNKPWFDITINGCRMTIRPGMTCKLPTPFYDKYRETLRSGMENDRRFAEPTNPGTKSGYMHVNPETGLAVILGKGPLASIAEREQNDRQP